MIKPRLRLFVPILETVYEFIDSITINANEE